MEKSVRDEWVILPFRRIRFRLCRMRLRRSGWGAFRCRVGSAHSQIAGLRVGAGIPFRGGDPGNRGNHADPQLGRAHCLFGHRSLPARNPTAGLSMACGAGASPTYSSPGGPGGVLPPCLVLRACLEKDRGYLAPHSITSSARASSEGGTPRPSAFAVLRLMTSSNLVGCSIGRSAGLAPFRILST